MRSCALRFLVPQVAALVLPVTLPANEVATGVAPSAAVSFRGVSFGHDMGLRETPALSPPAAFSPKVQPASVPPTSPSSRFALEALLGPVPSTPADWIMPPGAGDLALQPTAFTPYDRYISTVRSVINNLKVHDATMARAARLVKQGHRYRYCLCDPYRADLPARTEARQAGDCKSKSLWLYDNLGDRNALFVIGKAQKRSRTSHAWIYWRCDERWWILDCTERSDPIAADSIPSDRYVPYYSYGAGSAYRHKATRLMLTGALHPSAKPVADLR